MPEEPKKKRYGWFSAKSVEVGSRTAIYRHVDGREVEITGIFDSDKIEDIGFNWDDAVCLGEVTHWLRVGRQGRHRHVMREPIN